MIKYSASIKAMISQSGNEFYGVCPDLPGLLAVGETEIEVRKNIEELAIAYIKTLLKFHDPIPKAINLKKEHVIGTFAKSSPDDIVILPHLDFVPAAC